MLDARIASSPGTVADRSPRALPSAASACRAMPATCPASMSWRSRPIAIRSDASALCRSDSAARRTASARARSASARARSAAASSLGARTARPHQSASAHVTGIQRKRETTSGGPAGSARLSTPTSATAPDAYCARSTARDGLRNATRVEQVGEDEDRAERGRAGQRCTHGDDRCREEHRADRRAFPEVVDDPEHEHDCEVEPPRDESRLGHPGHSGPGGHEQHADTGVRERAEEAGVAAGDPAQLVDGEHAPMQAGRAIARDRPAAHGDPVTVITSV